MALTAPLSDYKAEIIAYAKKEKLDFFEVIFEMVESNEMNTIASYGGFPNRYPHWRFGMEYENLNKSYTYGLSKIYELVINNDPCYAYLMRSNSDVDQKLVMAHVYGHSDFFKNNVFFKHTTRKMMDQAGNHRARIQRLMLRHGQQTIEDFIDICLSIENLIDLHAPMQTIDFQRLANKESDPAAVQSEARPERDVLLYLLENAPLETWQQEVLAIMREESYYFGPQRQTKIMNEGWASYWHSTLMTGYILKDDEIIDYAERHSCTLQSSRGQLNPYKVGLELLRDIETRWNKGQFGKDYDSCDKMHEKIHWDKKLGLGRDKIFEVRRIHNDVTFLDNFLTPEFCAKQQLFTYAYNNKKEQYEVESRDFHSIKKKLLQMLTNGGNPVIRVIERLGEGDGDLSLQHVHEGADLKLDYAKETLMNLYKIWKKPIHLETIVDETPKLFSFDGQDHRERRIS